MRPVPAFAVLPLLALLAFAWLLGHLTATDGVQQFSLVAMIIVFVWGAVGTVVAKALLFPLSFLLFAVPAGHGLIPTLQDFSAWFAVSLLDLSGLPVLLEGRFISVPFGRWEVAEACSGIRALIACLAMGYLYAGLTYRTWSRRVGFVLASAVVPILANGVRIYGIVLLGYLAGNPAAVAVDHILTGWVFISIVMVLLLVLGHRWREKPEEAPAPAGVSLGQTLPVPVRRDSVRGIVLFTVVAIMVVGFAPVSAELLWHRLDEWNQLSLRPPATTSPWKEGGRGLDGWTPRFFAPSAELAQTYTSGDQSVKLYAAYYEPREKTAKLVSTVNVLYDRARWQRVREGEAAVTLGGQAFRVRETVIRSADSSLIVWSWYRVDGTFTSNAYVAKLLLARAKLASTPQASAAFAVAAVVQIPEAQTIAVLRNFLSHLSLQDSFHAHAEPAN